MANPAPGDFKVHRTALIDGDIIVWKASAYARDHQQDELEVVEKVLWDVEDQTRRAFASEAIVCFSGPREENFRRGAYPLYKTSREQDRPPFHGLAVEAIEEEYRTFSRSILEADDCLGLLATIGTIDNPVMVSIDKDMRTIPGWHFNPDKDDFPVYVRPERAYRQFLIQWAMGDRTDGYKGIDNVGEAKAVKIVDELDNIWTGPWFVFNAYRAAGHTFEYALSQARCARILTTEDWDREAKRPILWTPYEHDLSGMEEWAAQEAQTE
jgi:DNA polymerase-1